MSRNWKRLWARKYSPMIAASFLLGFQKRKYFDMCKNKLFVPEGNLYAIYWDHEEFKQLVKNYTDLLLKQNMIKYAKIYEGEFKKFLEWTKKINKIDFSRLSNEQLADWVRKLDEYTITFGEWQFLSFVVLEGPGVELEEKLKKYPNKSELLQAVSTTEKETIIAKARVELLKIIKNRRTSRKYLEGYTKKYSWIPMYEYCDKPWTIKDFKRQAEEIKQPEKELLGYYKIRKQHLSVYRNFYKSIKDKKLKKLVEIIHSFVYLKEMRDDYRRHGYLLLLPFWKEISKRTRLSIVESNHLLANELQAILKGKKPDRKEIKQRLEKYALWLKEGKLNIFSGSRAGEIATFVKTQKGQKDIIGNVASPGKTMGKARIIFHQGEFRKFKRGEILVTTMTHPEFVVIMKKARGIVTDEGGITCHAAIVSRELGIPCIIGTKNATQVLKDGDLVEVDANLGIVKKLTK